MTTGICLSLFFYFCLFDLNQQSVYLRSLCGLLICIGAEALPVADAARRRWSKTTSTKKGIYPRLSTTMFYFVWSLPDDICNLII